MQTVIRRLGLFFSDPQLVRFTRPALTFLLVTLALVWGGMYWIVQAKRQDALESERRQNINLAHTLAEQSLRVIQSVDQATLRVNEALVSGEFVNKDLVRIARETGLAETIITQLSYIGADGKFIASNIDLNGAKTGNVDLSEREHVKVHLVPSADAPQIGQGLFIGKTLVGKVSGKRTIQLSRKLTMPDRTVNGVVVVSLNPDYFEQNFKVLSLNTLGQVALVGGDGFVRSVVKGGESNSAMKAPAFWVSNIRAETEPEKVLSVIDTGPNQAILAAKQVGLYPIYLVVQTSVTEALSDWYDTRNVAFALTALFSLALVSAAISYLYGIESGHES